MSGFSVGARGVVAAGLAVPLAMLLVGTGGGMIFDPLHPLQVAGTPYWILVFYGLFELGLAGALWIPYLHRLAGALVALDAVAQATMNASAGREGHAATYFVMAMMGTAIAFLWTSVRVVVPRPWSGSRHAAA